ncbi:hypothetical protein Dimus_028171 [Dionaea muscipula]
MSMSSSSPSRRLRKVKTKSLERINPGGAGREIREMEEARVVAADDQVKEPMSPGARLLQAPSMDSYVIATMGSKKIIDIDVIREGLKQTLIKHPRFSSKLVLIDGKKDDEKKGQYWIQTKVNIDDHMIIVPDLDPNMESSAAHDLFIEDYVSNQTRIPMDLSKPLWEIHILNIKTSNANAVAVWKMHHSLGDGMSLISLVLACTRKTSNPDELPSIPKAKQSNSSHGPAWRYLLAAIWLMLKLIWNTFAHFGHFAATAFFLQDTKTPIYNNYRPGVLEPSPKRIVHRIVSLDDIKLLKNEMNSTINDVIVGITNAALSRYLHRKYGEEGVQLITKRDSLMKSIRIRASVIVNIRHSVGIQELADMMEKGSKCRWGNKIGYILVPFHVAFEKDPLVYIRKIKAIIDQKKLSLEAKLSFYVTLLVLKTLGIKSAVALAYRVLSHASLMISNVVGPAEEISFYGHPVTYIAPSTYGLPTGLLIHFQSYINQMSIVVCADQDLVPDPHRLCDDMEESIQQMKKAVIDQKNN